MQDVGCADVAEVKLCLDMFAYTSELADFGLFLLTGAILTLIVSLPILAVVLLLRRRQRRAEQERMRQAIDEKEHLRVKFDRSHPQKGKLEHVEANTMPLGLRKLVRTGSPYDKGIMG